MQFCSIQGHLRLSNTIFFSSSSYSFPSHEKSAEDGCESDSESETKTMLVIYEVNRTGHAKFVLLYGVFAMINPIMSST